MNGTKRSLACGCLESMRKVQVLYSVLLIDYLCLAMLRGVIVEDVVTVHSLHEYTEDDVERRTVLFSVYLMAIPVSTHARRPSKIRSEERRVGKECPV